VRGDPPRHQETQNFKQTFQEEFKHFKKNYARCTKLGGLALTPKLQNKPFSFKISSRAIHTDSEPMLPSVRSGKSFMYESFDLQGTEEDFVPDLLVFTTALSGRRLFPHYKNIIRIYQRKGKGACSLSAAPSLTHCFVSQKITPRRISSGTVRHIRYYRRRCRWENRPRAVASPLSLPRAHTDAANP